MPPRPIRERNRISFDTLLFAIALLVLVAAVSFFAAYENGYFADTAAEVAVNGSESDAALARDLSSGTSQSANTSSMQSSDAASGVEPSEPLSQSLILNDNESNKELYYSLSEPERESLQRMADAIDVTLLGKQYQGVLSDADLDLAHRYRRLIHPTRWREFWFRAAVRTAGFPQFQRLRDRGDEDDFQSAAGAWAKLDGLTRGLILELLQAIEDGDHELLNAHQDTIEQHSVIFGKDIPGTTQPSPPLRASRP